MATGLAGPVAAASSDPVIMAAGDIACDPGSSSFNGGNGTSGACRQKYTSDLIVNSGAVATLALGDDQYYCGSLTAFQQSYDLSWGRVKPITHPAVGNHEYLTSGGTGCNSSNAGAAGHFAYFGAAAGQPGQGYYSFDVGAWHLVSLNSNCSSAGGCGTTSPQYAWLASDLATHPTACTLAFWHIPLYSSGGRANNNMKTLWQLLYDNHADLVLAGHDHTYERFAPQDANGHLDDARGLRSFIVGTGGSNHTSFVTTAANSEVRDATTFGVLSLTLHPTSYDWTFLPEAGKTFTDSGSTACHGPGGGGDTTPPSIPTGVSSTATSSTSVAVSWTASTDNVGVTGYTVWRDGTPVGAPTGASFTDTTASPFTTYIYTVTARDAAGNTSGQSAPATVTTPPASGTTVTFTPSADAYIRADLPNSNAGSATTLQVDGGPAKRFLAQFTVSGLGGAVTSAKLRLYGVDPSDTGGQLRSVTGSWSESTVTWNTSPTFGASTVSSVGSVSTGQWYEWDVTALVTGNGTFTLGMVSSSTNGADYTSREGISAQRPQLVVTTS
ncbi:MAG: DNRLRE domain-containing protein [Kineosporiaceae bacterium]